VPIPVLRNPDIARGVEAAVRKTRWRLRVGLVLVLGAVVGAYLGGQRVSACSSSVQPTAGTCETDVRLSLTGAAIGVLVCALLLCWWRDRNRR
jgi:hypothetical protein